VEATGGDLGALLLGDHSLDLYCKNGVGAAADWRTHKPPNLSEDMV